MAPDPAEELIDWIDAEGNVLGTVTRQQMRARRLPHRSTAILVFNRQGELFIHLRTATKDLFPAHWDVSVGGVLAAGESFDEGAVREVREELGVDVRPERLFLFRYADKDTVAQAMVYRATHDGPFCLQKEEIQRGQFVPLSELPDWKKREPFCPDGWGVWTEYLQGGHHATRDSATPSRGA
jgi:isopentenyldiphosphate isomerase